MDILVTTIIVTIVLVAHVKADIRCYCNDASCISTGYMCKSALGSCFSQFSYDGDPEVGMPSHGCAESLPREDRSGCVGGAGDIIKTRGGQRHKADDMKQWPLLMCCTDDMCNYMDNIDIDIYIDTKLNDSILKGQKLNTHGSSSRESNNNHPRHLEAAAYQQQRDLWFKAAVIAVPIAGGFILILLVLCAVRMLHNDSRRHRHLLHLRHHHSLAKAQLYVTDHFCEKVHAHTNCGVERTSALYRDVNVTLERDDKSYDKLRNSQLHAGSCSSVLLLDKTNNANTATIV